MSVAEKLELQLERELDRARAADLVERVQAATLAAPSQVAGQRLCRLPEKGIRLTARS
jgi:hypothetical protein